MTSLTRIRKSTGLLVGVGVGGGELEDVAGLRARELLVELGDDRAAADLVEVVLGGEARQRLAVWEPAMSMVTWSPSMRRRSTVTSSAKLLAEVVDPVVDLLVGRLGLSMVDPQAVVAADGDWGRTSTTASKTTSPVSSPAVMSISGGGDDVDLVLADRLGVVLGQRVLEGLGPGRPRCRGGPRGAGGAPCRAGTRGCGPPGRCA